MKTILFLHIPKTGGTSIAKLFEREYPEPDAVVYREHWRPGMKCRVVWGHFAYGFHTHFEDSCYVTMLRHPVDRAISHYYHALRETDHHLHEAAGRMSLREYALSDMGLDLDNGQCRWISGIRDSEAQACFRTALQNLRSFSVVGVLENFAGFAGALGLPPPYPVERKGMRPSMYEIPFATYEAIVARNRWDMALYQEALGLQARHPSETHARHIA
ncbi:MAG: sulfotransferase family 2 domain-containing protein [Kiritimatiellae bacterium]|nr:sulfotransferase family 2 domain-containing protein [Kiritimatiellia bacterium]